MFQKLIFKVLNNIISHTHNNTFLKPILSQNQNNTTSAGIDEARIATGVHIILPLGFSIFLFFTLLCLKVIKWNRFFLLKLPLPPVTKFYKTMIECKSYFNNKNIEDFNYDNRKTIFIEELEEQEQITTISMIVEASMESSFQFFFQGLFSLPTLVFSFMDIHDGGMDMTDLVNWKIASIVISFLTFAFTSFNIR